MKLSHFKLTVLIAAVCTSAFAWPVVMFNPTNGSIVIPTNLNLGSVVVTITGTNITGNVTATGGNVVTNNATGLNLSGTWNGTATSASTLLGSVSLSQLPSGVVTNLAAAFLPIGMPNPFAMYHASSFASNAEGTVVSGTWPDLSGNGKHLQLLNAIVSQTGVFGQPALLGNGTTTIASNLTFIPTGMNVSNLTIRIKYRDTDSISVKVMVSFGTPTYLASYLVPWFTGTGDQGGGAAALISPGGFGSCSTIGSGSSHFFVVRDDGKYIDTWLDGVKHQASYARGFTTQGLGVTNGISLWDTLATGFQSKSYIAELTIWTNSLTDAQISALNIQDFNLSQQSRPTITIVGTSKSQGWVAVPGGDFAKLLAAKFPGYRIEASGSAGTTSAMGYSNVMANIINQPHGSPWIVLLESFGVNEQSSVPFANMVATNQIVETNLVNICNAFNTNGAKVLIWSPISDNRETNGYTTNLTAWGSNNWRSIASGYINFSLNTNYGVPGCYTNTTNFPDNLHESSLVVTDMVVNYFVPAMQQIIAGTNFSGAFSGLVNASSLLSTNGIYVRPGLGTTNDLEFLATASGATALQVASNGVLSVIGGGTASIKGTDNATSLFFSGGNLGFGSGTGGFYCIQTQNKWRFGLNFILGWSPDILNTDNDTTLQRLSAGTILFKTNGVFLGTVGASIGMFTNGVSLVTNYVAANFTPVAGLVIFAASNNWMFAITVTRTNPFVQIAP